jgi:hypothetical protein
MSNWAIFPVFRMELLKICGTGVQEKNKKVKMRTQASATAHELAIDWPSECQSAEPITFLAKVSSTGIIFHQH